MNLKIVVLFISLVSSNVALAGAANAQLECKAKDGFTLSGHVPGDFAEFELAVKGAGKTAKLSDATGSISIVEDLENGVYTLVANRTTKKSYGSIQLYALPKTVKMDANESGYYKATFTGKVSAEIASDFSVQKTVSCSLEYSL